MTSWEASSRFLAWATMSRRRRTALRARAGGGAGRVEIPYYHGLRFEGARAPSRWHVGAVVFALYRKRRKIALDIPHSTTTSHRHVGPSPVDPLQSVLRPSHLSTQQISTPSFVRSALPISAALHTHTHAQPLPARPLHTRSVCHLLRQVLRADHSAPPLLLLLPPPLYHLLPCHAPSFFFCPA